MGPGRECVGDDFGVGEGRTTFGMLVLLVEGDGGESIKSRGQRFHIIGGGKGEGPSPSSWQPTVDGGTNHPPTHEERLFIFLMRRKRTRYGWDERERVGTDRKKEGSRWTAAATTKKEVKGNCV